MNTLIRVADHGPRELTKPGQPLGRGTCYPKAGLVEESDSVLYGAMYEGGTHGNGVMFKVNRDGTYCVVRS